MCRTHAEGNLDREHAPTLRPEVRSSGRGAESTSCSHGNCRTALPPPGTDGVQSGKDTASAMNAAKLAP